MTTCVFLSRDEEDLDIEVDFIYHSICRGHRDKYGVPEEPDTPAEIEITAARRVDNKQEIELTTREEDFIRPSLWDYVSDQADDEPPERDQEFYDKKERIL